jgi:hypothetical protein
MGLAAPVGAPEKVCVEAELDRGGDVVLTLCDIRMRRQYVQERGHHTAQISIDALQGYGFPMQFFAELKKGYPVRFRMNLSGFETLLGGGLDGWPNIPDKYPGYYMPKSRGGDDAKPRRTIRGPRPAYEAPGPRVSPIDFCLYEMEKSVVGGRYHRGYILEDEQGEVCETSFEEGTAPEAIEMVAARAERGGRFSRGRKVLMQPLKQITDKVWLGRSTGAAFEGLEASKPRPPHLELETYELLITYPNPNPRGAPRGPVRKAIQAMGGYLEDRDMRATWGEMLAPPADDRFEFEAFDKALHAARRVVERFPSVEVELRGPTEEDIPLDGV